MYHSLVQGRVGAGEASFTLVTDVESGPVKLYRATRIVKLADGEEGAGREVREDVRLLCSFWEGQEDELTRVC